LPDAGNPVEVDTLRLVCPVDVIAAVSVAVPAAAGPIGGVGNRVVVVEVVEP
jgi:hypothetical protein